MWCFSRYCDWEMAGKIGLVRAVLPAFEDASSLLLDKRKRSFFTLLQLEERRMDLSGWCTAAVFALDKYGVTAIRSDDGRPKFIVWQKQSRQKKEGKGNNNGEQTAFRRSKTIRNGKSGGKT